MNRTVHLRSTQAARPLRKRVLIFQKILAPQARAAGALTGGKLDKALPM
ncbi:hypothetical protein [Cribrihabitans neustonicus]